MPVLRRYGAEHLETGKPILYTSADSVLQIAAHEEAFGLEFFRLVRGEAGPADGPDGRETDLFAGLA